MNFNGINNLMRQQLGALKDLDELIEFDGKQDATHTISQEDIAFFKDHVDRLKNVCNTAVALSQHYQAAEKVESKVTSTDDDVESDDGEKVPAIPYIEEPPKEKKTRTRKTAPKVEPVVEDDLDDLLS